MVYVLLQVNLMVLQNPVSLGVIASGCTLKQTSLDVERLSDRSKVGGILLEAELYGFERNLPA